MRIGSQNLSWTNRALILGLQIAANGIAGMVFARAMAGLMGASSTKDAFDVAYSVPFVVMGTLGLTWLQGIVISRITQSREDTGTAQAYFTWCFRWTLGISVLGAALSAVFSPWLAQIMAPGLPADEARMLRELLIIMSPIIVTFSISAFVSAVLVAHEVPVGIELTQLFARIITLGCIGLDLASEATSIASILVLGGSIGLVFNVVCLRRYTAIRFRLGFDAATIADLKRNSVVQGGGFLVASILAQLTHVLSMRVSSEQPGTIAILGYASIVSISVGQLIGKSVSQATAYQVNSGAGGSTSRISAAALMIAMPIGVVAYLGMPALLTEFIYKGRFLPHESALIVTCAQLMLFNLPFQVIIWTTHQFLLKHRVAFLSPALFWIAPVIQLLLIVPFWAHFGIIGVIYAQVLGNAVQATSSLLAGRYVR